MYDIYVIYPKYQLLRVFCIQLIISFTSISNYCFDPAGSHLLTLAQFKMRTQTIAQKLTCLPYWLKFLLISRKRVLNTRQAAVYLKTTIKSVYHWSCYYHLPSTRDKKHHLRFKRKDIDAWLVQRKRKDFPRSTRKRPSRFTPRSNER